ncbi:MAG: dihydroorotate dehydrogenase-like protein [Deferribacterales bacterium]
MADLSIDYMGMKLSSPVMAASSTLTKDIANIRKAEDAGAGAVVLKSLFEEEIRQDSGLSYEDVSHTEAYDYISADAAMVYGSGEYLEYVRKAAEAVSIPVIASINCEGGRWWTDFAVSMEEAGADAIELNISFVPFDASLTSAEVEARYVEVIESVKSKVSIPVSVKIGDNFSSIPYMVQKIKNAGADAVTMFNRYYQMKINTRTLELEPVHYYSETQEAYNVIRWVAAVSRQCPIDISATTGVHDEDTLIQYILAGAKTVQTASMLYKKGFSAISDLNTGLAKWLDKRNLSGVKDAVGLAMRKKIRQYHTIERIQYIKVADGHLLQ